MNQLYLYNPNDMESTQNSTTTHNHMESTTQKKKKIAQTYMQSWLVDLIGEAELLADLNGNGLGGEKRRKRERESMIGKKREIEWRREIDRKKEKKWKKKLERWRF